MAELVVLLAYGVPALLLGALAVFLYARAVASRRTHRCPTCGTRVDTELMTASSCTTCGSPLL